MWANLWMCPPVNNEPVRWWCGNESETAPCQTGVDANFPIYTRGYILGFPPITSLLSASVTTATAGTTVITPFSAGPDWKGATVTVPSIITVTAASQSKAPTDLSLPVQFQKHPASLTTAQGVAIGVTLGVVAIGFFSFLSWREAARRRGSKPPVHSQEAVLDQTGKSAVAPIDRPWLESHELQDAQRPLELGGRARTELAAF